MSFLWSFPSNFFFSGKIIWEAICQYSELGNSKWNRDNTRDTRQNIYFMQINILFPFGKSIEISIKIEERVLRCAGTCFIKNSTVKYSREMIITEYFKTLKIFCQIDTRKIFLLSSSPVPHFSLPTKLRTTNLGIRRCVFTTTQIWATSECTQIVSQYLGWAESKQTKLKASVSRVSTTLDFEYTHKNL